MKNTHRQPQNNLMARLMAKTSGVAREGELPFVSVITPTWNRREFLPYLIYMFQYQDYPAEKRELVILDDSAESNADLVAMLNQKQQFTIRYYHQTERLTIGAKRNKLNELARGEYIICMDDDDYYRSDKISYTIGEMRKHNALFAGCDQIPIWYSHINRIYRTSSISQHHALNGTFAYHRNFLRNHRYDDQAELAEEISFTKDFSSPVLQLDPERSILCIAHSTNTYDKNFILGTCELISEDIEDIVKDKSLLKHFKRLNLAPLKTKINWARIEGVIINVFSDDNAADLLRKELISLGMPEEKLQKVTLNADHCLADYHLSALDKAVERGWNNYLVLDGRCSLVHQDKTIKDVNNILDIFSTVPWDVLLLGAELRSAIPIQSLAQVVKPVCVTGPVGCLINATYYPKWREMLLHTRDYQQDLPKSAPESHILYWDKHCLTDRWYLLSPGWVYRANDDNGNDCAPKYFKKIYIDK
ncbi:glycosyl transferase family A [Enterobacterales bacterium CwR94]|nr:glycosyl transferase family A [Enterobacterales bacterium CwR94]